MSPGPSALTPAKRDGWLLAVLVLLAALIRFPALGSAPPGPFCDEAAIATTAFSLGTTGRDLSGTWLPLYASHPAFAHWGEPNIITQPVYQYLAVPFVLASGPDVVALRVLSATLGALTIPAVFLLGSALFDRRVGLAGAALLALSPWHAHFSRIGFEAISLPLLLALSAWLLLRGVARPRDAGLGTAGMALATYAYPTALVFVPLLLAAFALTHRRALASQPRSAVACIALFCALELPNLATFDQRGRTQEVAVWSADVRSEAVVRALDASESPVASAIRENEFATRALVFAANYATHLGPSFLFLDGDPNPRHGPNGFGMVHGFSAALLCAGGVVGWRRRREPAVRFAFAWLLLAPVGASLTTGGPHAIRAIPMLPMLDIVAGLGAVEAVRLARDRARGWDVPRTIATIVAGVVLAAIPLETARYWRHYHGAYLVESAPYWQAGVAEAVALAESHRPAHDRILVSPTIFDAYSFVLLEGAIDYEKLDASLPVNAQLAPFGYQILFPDADAKPGSARDLILLSARDTLADLDHRVIAELPYPDGSPHLRLIETISTR